MCQVAQWTSEAWAWHWNITGNRLVLWAEQIVPRTLITSCEFPYRDTTQSNSAQNLRFFFINIRQKPHLKTAIEQLEYASQQLVLSEFELNARYSESNSIAMLIAGRSNQKLITDFIYRLQFRELGVGFICTWKLSGPLFVFPKSRETQRGRDTLRLRRRGERSIGENKFARIKQISGWSIATKSTKTLASHHQNSQPGDTNRPNSARNQRDFSTANHLIAEDTRTKSPERRRRIKPQSHEQHWRSEEEEPTFNPAAPCSTAESGVFLESLTPRAPAALACSAASTTYLAVGVGRLQPGGRPSHRRRRARNVLDRHPHHQVPPEREVWSAPRSLLPRRCGGLRGDSGGSDRPR